jgi:hypothetical protein
VKGEPQMPDADIGQSTAAFPTRPFSLYRGRHDRKAFVSAEQKYARYSRLAREASLRCDIVAMHAEHYFRMLRAAGQRDE